MLAYTLKRLLTHQAQIERNAAEVDSAGGQGRPVWRAHATLPCRLWWAKASGARSVNREYVAPQRTVPVTEGGILLEPGADVTEQDRIVAILDAHGDVLHRGVFEIVAVVDHGDHVELSVVRARLGA